MTLQDVIEQAVADAFIAGAQWQAIRNGQDSAAVGRELRRWQEDRRFQQSVKRHQKAATEAVGRAIMRLRLETQEMQDRQGTLFGTSV